MSETNPNGALESREDFKDNPQGQYKYWQVELSAAERNLRNFHNKGNHIVERFLASSPTQGIPAGGTGASYGSSAFHLNLFYANTTTLMSTLYGQIPTVDVSRRYADSRDDVGRVAAEIMERLLNNEMSANGKEVESVLKSDLLDRLTVGLGAGRIRYDAKFEDMELTDTGEESEEVMTYENAHTEYVHWRDVRWGWARDFSTVPWVGFREYLTKDEVKKRFDEKAADKLDYKVQQAMQGDDEPSGNDENAGVWMKAEIWEIWDKLKRQVVWMSPGYDRVLDTKDDPLKLNDFYPCPPFFIANATSTLYIPTADYHLTQDLYNEIDKLQTRISIITEAVKVVGVYDSSNGEIARMLKEGTDNDLIPVENWALFAEKGGIQGQVDWFPIQDVVAALSQLIQIRDQTIGLLQQVTGMTDLMQGQLSNQYEGVGQSQIKAQMGSTRIQSLQDHFAQYATDLMQIKAEVIARHCEPKTIAQMANVSSMMENPQLIQAAIQLIKQPDQARLQVKIRAESVSMVDYAKLKNERTEYINALATFMQSAAPMMEFDKGFTPLLLQLLQWGLAGFKGASEIEGVLDKAIQDVQQAQQQAAQQPPQPSPEEIAAQQQQQQNQFEMQMQQMAQQFQMQLEQTKTQGEMQKMQAKTQSDIAVRQSDHQADLAQIVEEHKAQMAQQEADMIASLTETRAKMQADIQKEIAQSQANIMQTNASAEAETVKDATSAEIEIAKDAAKNQMEITKDAAKTGLKIGEIEASAQAKLKEIDAQPTAKPEKKPDA